jgi:hypothetical protein
MRKLLKFSTVLLTAVVLIQAALSNELSSQGSNPTDPQTEERLYKTTDPSWNVSALGTFLGTFWRISVIIVFF